MVFGDVLRRNAGKFPNKTAIVHEDTRLTFREFNERVNGLANALLKKGLNKGDRIGVLVHNCHQFIEIYFAAAKTGGIFCPYNNHLKQWELKDIFDYSTPRFLFVDADFGAMVSALKPELSYVEQFVAVRPSDMPF
ncbi:MAG TPA: AMP-binding protein, partial [Syntrophorhabdaceae bacterium]|nr:AMP-binding protein [Syntrophorhabdaceae bacterium]